jgi:glycosyltransferase involved in cell wall biosynthesis
MKKYVISFNPFRITTVPRVIVFLKTYNSARTLQRAIDSVLNQTFKDFRLYIFDNASTDNTREIILKNAAKDKRIFPLHIATNNIINDYPLLRLIFKESMSEWLCVIDADDEYEPNYIEEMYNLGNKNNLEIVMCGYKKILEETGEIIKDKKLDENIIITDNNEMLENFIKIRGYLSYPWNKLQRITVLKTKMSNAGSFKPVYEHADDTTKQSNLYRKINRSGFIKNSLYKYFQHKDMYSLRTTENNIITYWNSLNTSYIAQKRIVFSTGEPDKKNIDFLYAIFLSLVEEAINRIIITKDTSDDAIEALEHMFHDDRLKHIIQNNDFDKEIVSLQNPTPTIKKWFEQLQQLFSDTNHIHKIKRLELEVFNNAQVFS